MLVRDLISTGWSKPEERYKERWTCDWRRDGVVQYNRVTRGQSAKGQSGEGTRSYIPMHAKLSKNVRLSICGSPQSEGLNGVAATGDVGGCGSTRAQARRWAGVKQAGVGRGWA